MTSTIESVASFERYVPRIATNWDVDAPGRQWQELDATLCFVDISGFTNLSEKLARRGRIGAEELTSVLNLVFANMLEIAYLQGGSLLKFGGDALLLMFTGYDHATRAASAAVEMRTALRVATDGPTTAGRVRLRMSVGIHSGPIHIFRVGSVHQELVIAGLGGTTTTAMEKFADPGEILVSAGTRDRLPADATGNAKGAGWLLRWRKAHCIAPGPVSRDARDPESLKTWVPVELREYLGAGDTESEHRIASVGFIRFCGVDQRLADEGADWVAEAIDETMALIQLAAAEEEITFLGTDINEDGGKAILVAGAPIARDGDEGRLLRAVRAVADAPAPLDLHLGVNRGHVFTGEVGTEFRSTYTVMGDTVNVAARLMAAAPARSVYATPGLLDQSGTLFAATALPPLQVKGKSEPLTAYSVGEELGDRSFDAREELPFVGRSGEIAELRTTIGRAKNGSGDVVKVIGDAGSGKSRLVRQALLDYPDLPTITIRAERYGSATPYRPWRDPLRGILGIERGANDEMAAALERRVAAVAPDLLPVLPLVADVVHIEIPDTPEVAEIEPKFRQDRIVASVVSLVDRLVTEPVLLEIEDAQWMDEASTHLLGHLAQTIDERPWALIVTRRGDAGGFLPDEGRVIAVGNLSPDETEQLVNAATPATPLHPKDVKAICARSGGNPLFIEELLRIVTETGSADELPDSIGSLLSTSIDALPFLARRVLRYSSVLGRSFRVSTARAVLSDDTLQLDAATRDVLSDFIEDGGPGVLRFRNAMVRDVAYDGLSYRRREDLHRRAARAIAETTRGNPEDVADQLAMHYSLGNDHENTWRYARVAAARAMRSFANTEAATQLERALTAARRLPDVSERDRSTTWAQLGDVRERAGLFDAALEAYRRSSKLIVDDPLAQAELLLKRAWVRERAGTYSIALREATRARRVAEGANDESDTYRVAANASAFQALVRLRQGKLKDALARARIALVEADRVGEKAATARAYGVIAWTHMMTDDPRALDVCRQALALYQELGDLVGQNDMNNNLGVLAYFDGRWDDALEYYQQSRDGAERVGNIVDVGFAEANIGELLVNQRRFDEAEQRLGDAVRVLRSTGELSMATFAELQVARILKERGKLGQAEAMLRDVARESEANGFTANTLEAALHLADCSIRAGDSEGALEQLDRAMAEAGEESAMFTLTEARLRALARARTGHRKEAVAILEAGVATARDRGQPYDEALMLDAVAETIEPDYPEVASESRVEAERIMRALGVRA
jgi:class 3 adenylate cyclase/tetratricopeptide (TPR) repeat protein